MDVNCHSNTLAKRQLNLLITLLAPCQEVISFPRSHNTKVLLQVRGAQVILYAERVTLSTPF